MYQPAEHLNIGSSLSLLHQTGGSDVFEQWVNAGAKGTKTKIKSEELPVLGLELAECERGEPVVSRLRELLKQGNLREVRVQAADTLLDPNADQVTLEAAPIALREASGP